MKVMKKKHGIITRIVQFATSLIVAIIAVFLAKDNVVVALGVWVFIHTYFMFELGLKVADIEKELNKSQQSNTHVKENRI